MRYLIVDFTDNEIDRIASKISFDRSSGCWNWKGAKIKDRGYGAFNYRGRTEMTHRLMYAWLIKPIPQGVGNGIPVLDHVVCDNRACCNPDHMILGPQGRNALRGSNPPSINSRKIHCIRGHLLPSEPNERWGSKGRSGRRCIICRQINARRRRAQKD